MSLSVSSMQRGNSSDAVERGKPLNQRRKPPFEKRFSLPEPHTSSPTSAAKPASFTDDSIPGLPIVPPTTVEGHAEKELSVRRLDDVHLHLWWAGRPANIRPLHSQRMMKRDIVPSENIGLHLVWFDTTYYVKPLPEWLLNWDYYDEVLCADEQLFRAANGLLSTYTKLVQHPSDFRIARELGLFPDSLERWEDWSRIAASVQRGNGIADGNVSERYRYGELRLRRLNHIYRIFRRENYHSVYAQYDQFFSKNFAWLLLLVVYLSVILSAMQVVLSTAIENVPFENVSYWVSIAALVFIGVVIGLQVFLFVGLFLYHLVCTILNLERERVPWAGHTKGGS